MVIKANNESYLRNRIGFVEKKCGGFHADFVIEWYRGQERYQAFICFGCCELKLLGPGINVLYDLGVCHQQAAGTQEASRDAQRHWEECLRVSAGEEGPAAAGERRLAPRLFLGGPRPRLVVPSRNAS